MGGFLDKDSFIASQLDERYQIRVHSGLPTVDLTSSNPTECGYLFPEIILNRAFAAYLKHRHYQPDSKGYYEARRAISDYYNHRAASIDINPEHIFITASTSESYSLIFSLLADPGDNFLAPDISYPLFEYLAEHHRLKLKNYVLREENGKWHYDADSFRKVKNLLSRGVLLVSPHNPTGLILDSGIEELSGLNLPLVCDEVFADFIYGAKCGLPCGVSYPDLPVFYLNGISKMFALPDLKLGWIALNDIAYEKYGKRLEILNDTFLSCSTMIQSALPLIFNEGKDFTKSMHHEINNNIYQALEILQSCTAIKVAAPQGGYYLFPEIKTPLSDNELVIELLNQGVLVHPGSYYGLTQSTHILISCLTPHDNLIKGLVGLKNYLSRC